MTVPLTLFFPMFPFDPPENIKKPAVFICFQGDQKGILGRKGFKIFVKHIFWNTERILSNVFDEAFLRK